jgi:naphthoate synthase
MSARSDVTCTAVPGCEDIRHEKTEEGIGKIAILRPEVRSAFRPQAVELMIEETSRAFDARDGVETGVVILTGDRPDVFCFGGDRRVRGQAGHVDFKKLPRHP